MRDARDCEARLQTNGRTAVPDSRQRLDSARQAMTRAGRTSSPRRTRASAAGFQPDAAIPGADAQRLAAGPESPLDRATAARLVAALSGQPQLVSDRAVAGVRVELGAEVGRQVDRDAAVAGRHRPVISHRGPRGRAERDRAVAGVKLHSGELAGDAHAAVAGLHVEISFGVFQRDRSVSRRERELAPDVVRADAAVARLQLEPPVHVLYPDRAVAAPGHDIAVARHRHDELRGRRHVAHAEEDDLVRRLLHFDVDAVAVLLRVDFQLVDGVLRRPAPLDLDDDGFRITRPNLDRAVERRQPQIGRAGDGEALLLARDVPLRVHHHAGGEAERQGGGHGEGRKYRFHTLPWTESAAREFYNWFQNPSLGSCPRTAPPGAQPKNSLSRATASAPGGAPRCTPARKRARRGPRRSRPPAWGF